MINDTEKKKSFKKRNTAILLAACAFALGLGALSRVVNSSDDPLAKQPYPSVIQEDAALHTVPQDVDASTESAGLTPSEFASIADSIYEEASKEADAVFDDAEENTSPSLAVDGTPVDGPVKAQATYVLPCGTQLGKDFSMGIPVFSNTMQDWRTHNGVDFSAEKGTEVVCVADATVLSVSEDAAWGGVVELDFGNSVTAKYCGLQFDSITVAVGDTVKQGDTIGVLGVIPVEADDDIHLHFEMRVNGEIADPLEILGRGGIDE